jgi:hypothetical protein
MRGLCFVKDACIRIDRRAYAWLRVRALTVRSCELPGQDALYVECTSKRVT